MAKVMLDDFAKKENPCCTVDTQPSKIPRIIAFLPIVGGRRPAIEKEFVWNRVSNNWVLPISGKAPYVSYCGTWALVLLA